MLKNLAQAEELATALKRKALYESTWPKLAEIQVYSALTEPTAIGHPSYKYTIQYVSKNGRDCQTYVIDEAMLHAELLRIIADHYTEKGD